MISNFLRRLEDSGASLVHLRAGSAPMYWKNNEQLVFDEAPLTTREVRVALAAVMTDEQAAAFRRQHHASLDLRVAGYGSYRLDAYLCRDSEEAVFMNTLRHDAWALFRGHHELLAEARAAPDDADVYWNLGVAFIDQREPQLAWHAFERARALLPEDGGIHFELGKLLGHDLYRVDEAIAALERAASLPAPSAMVFVELAMMQRTSEQLADAESSVRRGLTFFPDDAKLLEALGVILLELERGREAIAVLERCLALHGDDAELEMLLRQARSSG